MFARFFYRTLTMEVELIFLAGVWVRIVLHGRFNLPQEAPYLPVDNPAMNRAGKINLLQFKIIKVVAGAVFGGEFFIARYPYINLIKSRTINHYFDSYDNHFFLRKTKFTKKIFYYPN